MSDHTPDQITLDRESFNELILSSHNELKRQRRSRWAMFGIKLSLFAGVVGMAYMTSQAKIADSLSNPNKDHVAVVEVYGAIAAGQLADADRLTPALHRAFQSPTSKAVAIRINSPGGSPVHAGRLFAEVNKLKALHPDKTVYSVIEDIGASAAYYIAASADKIYVDQASMVGSIGVITEGFGYDSIMEKVGVERRVLQAGKFKALLDPYAPANDGVTEHWQAMLDEVHDQFIAAVKEGRGDRLNLELEPDLFEGLIFTGHRSVELGIADSLGSLNDISREEVGAINIVDYTPAPDLLKSITGQASATMSAMFATLTTPSLR